MSSHNDNSARHLRLLRRNGLIALVCGVLAVTSAGLALTAGPAQAAGTSAVFSGGAGTYVAGNGMLFAKSGAALVLSVTTDPAVCVQVTDGSNQTVDIQTSGQNRTSWTFSGAKWVAGSGNGLVPLTVMAGKGTNNGNGGCTGNLGTVQASYTLDNAAPTATAALTPAPNVAGWNQSNVSIAWTGSDTGGSGVKTLSPASDSVSAEGTVTRITTVTDNVGNSGTGSVQVKLDKTAPTIAGSRTPAANANGWNNTPVTVSFTPSDATSGVKSSTAPVVLSSNGSNQSVTGTVTDNADNTTSTTVSGINIDQVAPTLSGAPTTPPNANGWYNGNVTIAWTATDVLSGTSNPANSIIGGEGSALTASATATDRAGNSSSTQSPAVKIDRTAPTTTVTAPPAWNKTDVTLTLVANDALSDVDKTYYRLDGGAQTAGTSVPVSTEGNHTLTYWSTDLAGNAELAHTVTFGIDKTTPTVGHTQSPVANADGWNNTNVTVTFTCSDSLSGIASCTAPQAVNTEGSNQGVTGVATDNAGNTATDPASVSIDKTTPTIIVDALPNPDANGWYNSDVHVTYTASDALSGIKSQDHGHTFGEGADQTDTATTTDAAGNSDSVTTPKISVDETAPTITGKIVGTPNAHGWFADDVTVHWTCDDNLSGVVACPDDSVVPGEGSNLSASASVTDKAENTATASVSSIKIDRTAPSTMVSGVPSSWADTPVTVDFQATDNLSQIDSTYYEIDGATTPVKGSSATVGDEGVHTISYWSVDNAGNIEHAQSTTVRIDLSAPTIESSQSPARNANGWNNTDVSVSFSCADQTALSGLKDCTGPQTIATEGKDQAVKGTAKDNAGTSTSTTAFVNIDKTSPTISGSPDRPANADGWYRDDVTVSFDAHDGLSGIDTVTTPQPLGEGADQSVLGTATDNAGNSATTSVHGINVDETPPTLSAAPTTSPNDEGWYNTDVTEVWAGDDALSGIKGGAPQDSVISDEGTGQTASAAVSDKAGNETSATSAPVKIDKTAPRTDVSSPSGWVNSSVDITLTAHDALSGVAATHYTVDDGQDKTGTTVTLTSEGTHTISYYSVDKAGNREGASTVTVQIDKSAPTISHVLDPAANGNGWNNSDVTVTFTCDDQVGLSGVASCTAPHTVSTEGADQEVDGTATDNAGNVAHDHAPVSLDKTKPDLKVSRSPAANAEGWNNTDVTVHFVATDALSGIDMVTADQTLGEGTDQHVVGTAVDAAGNSSSADIGHVNVDETAPTLSGKPTMAANADGWYSGDVTITWTAGDDRSGVAANSADSTIAGEGSGLTATATVSDLAGNDTTADSVPVNIDRTAPTTGADAPSGWQNSAVTVSLHAEDGLSGVHATYYTVDDGAQHQATTLTITAEGVHTVTYWSVDDAGNLETAKTVTVKVDTTKPTLHHTTTPAANADGWNNTPVTVHFDCADALSGVSGCSHDTTLSTDGAGQQVTGTAVDNAGNSQDDTATVNIDTVKPTISGAPDRAPNTHDWYAGDVTVTYACSDALSGIKECSSPIQLGEGQAEHAKGTAADTAGNTANATVDDINVDKTAPTLSGSPTTHPNASGWYNGDVTVEWTAADSLSGLDGPVPGDSIVSTEGTHQSASATVQDLAGNQTTVESSAFKIDRTAPVTSVSNVSDWSSSAVTVTLAPADNLSGPKATHYRLDGGAVEDGTIVTVSSEGVHTLEVWSVDNADNVEAHQNFGVKIDKTAPSISHSQQPVANEHGWNNTDVTVTFMCSDALSGIQSCTKPQTVTAQGQGQLVTGHVVDNAGNTADDQASIDLDKTKPTIDVNLSPDANARGGWFNTDVTATFTCADQANLSGVLSCPDPHTLGEGAGQHVTGTATDAAGNVSDPATISGINVDKTKPTLSGAPTTSPNGNGWYRGDVTVTWTASDALSGLVGQAPADSTITGEGDNLSASASVSDMAGNSRSATVSGIKIDRTAPTTGADAPSGWRNADVTVKLTATDNLSGVAATHYKLDGGATQDGTSLTVSTEGSHTVTYWSVDRAGNAETSAAVTVLVDKSAPTITGKTTSDANANGWYKAPVTVHFTCSDAVSGIATCQPDTTVSAQGPNSAIGTAVDNAGNQSTTTVGGIKIDTVAPSVTVNGVQDGAVYTLGAVPAITATANDATSQVDGPVTVTKTGGLANGVGTFTVKATATDKAGNVGTTTMSYQVVYGYGSTLFLQPVNDTAHQTGLSTSVFNAGQTIPMKFQLRNIGGQVVQTNTAPQWLNPVKGTSSAAAVNEAAYSPTETMGGVYSWDGTQYQFNWKTDKSESGSYWRVGVTLDDGKTYFVNIALK